MPHHLHPRGAQNQRCQWVWTGLRTSNEVTGRFAMHPFALAITSAQPFCSARIIGVLSHLLSGAFATYLRLFTINVEYWLPILFHFVQSRLRSSAYLMCTLLVHSCNSNTFIVSFTITQSILTIGGGAKVQGDLLLQITVELWLDENDTVQKLPQYIVFMRTICACDDA